MHNTFLEKASALNEEGKAYATAFIVRRKVPSSGKPGDKAIITADGQIHGWIGGGCTRGIVLKEALQAIQDKKPRYVTISPNAKENTDHHTKLYTMTCQSGGEVELYIEPVLPKPSIVLFGQSHIAMALAKLATAMDYNLQVVMASVDKDIFPQVQNLVSIAEFKMSDKKEKPYVVVCTQGDGDADALHKAISIGSDYLAFVASMKKANGIFIELREKDVNVDQLMKIKTPAGLDIGAKLPEEVAISILAEIIKDFRLKTKNESQGASENIAIPNDDFYMNPVCNIPIQKSTAKHVLDYEGKKVYFCCDGCKVSFEKAPANYIKA